MSLFKDFLPVSDEAWRQKLEADLKGKPWSKVEWKTDEGFTLPPYLRASDISQDKLAKDDFRRANSLNAPNGNWQIVQAVSMRGDGQKMEIVKEALAAEVGALFLDFSQKNADPKNFSEVAQQQNEVADLLDIQRIALHTEASIEQLKSLWSILNKKNKKLDFLTGTYFNSENIPNSEALLITEKAPFFRALGIDLMPLEEKGATLTQQLAVALSQTVDALTAEGVNAQDAAWQLAYRFPVGSSFMLELAKFRSFRVLIVRVLETLGVEGKEALSPFVIAETSHWNKSRYDMQTNMLRNTTEALSAAFGGAHGIVIQNFDRTEKVEDRFSARMSRNIQHLMKRESYLDLVRDPAGGSYYVEHLTDQLMASAWDLFQEMEAAGGYRACLDSGMLAEILADSLQQKTEAIRKRKRNFVGVSMSPNGEEMIPNLPQSRDRGPSVFENIRHRMDAWMASTGKRPQAALLLFGDKKMQRLRAQFASDLIASAGFKMSQNENGDQISDAIQHFSSQKPAVIVLCAADGDYSLDVLKSVRESFPKASVLIAGKPQEDLEADGFLFMGMDVIQLFEMITPSVSQYP